MGRSQAVPHAPPRDDSEEETPLEELEEYEVEDVVDHKIDRRGNHLFLIKWEGWEEKDNSWEVEENLVHIGKELGDKVKRFKNSQSPRAKSKAQPRKRPSSARTGRNSTQIPPVSTRSKSSSSSRQPSSPSPKKIRAAASPRRAAVVNPSSPTVAEGRRSAFSQSILDHTGGGNHGDPREEDVESLRVELIAPTFHSYNVIVKEGSHTRILTMQRARKMYPQEIIDYLLSRIMYSTDEVRSGFSRSHW